MTSVRRKTERPYRALTVKWNSTRVDVVSNFAVVMAAMLAVSRTPWTSVERLRAAVTPRPSIIGRRPLDHDRMRARVQLVPHVFRLLDRRETLVYYAHQTIAAPVREALFLPLIRCTTRNLPGPSRGLLAC